nr:TIGR01212 family radical SAM protein [Desulfobulbaceae bacterium]
MDINERVQARLNLFSCYYKAKYGKPIGKIALSVGVACPNRQSGGCVYCSAASFTPFYLEEGDSVREQLVKGKKDLNTRKFKRYLGYFQQETTTAAPEKGVVEDCLLVLSDPECVGLIISTRPDYVEYSFLHELYRRVSMQALGDKEILFELGLQTSHNRTLQFLNRNHTYEDFVGASEKIKQFPAFQLGVHLILGLPHESLAEMRATLELVVGVGVDAVKFHHLQIIRNTALEKIYSESPFKVYSAYEYMEILADLITYLPKSTVIHRLWSSSDRDLLVAPDWGGLGAHQLSGMLLAILEENDLRQGKRCLGGEE